MIIVFDTNAYLYLADGNDSTVVKQRVEMLRSAEAKYSEPIHALICDTVAQELISHLHDPMSEDDCMRFGACQAMYYHCGDKEHYGLLPQIWVQIAKELVDFEYSRLINNQKHVGQMLFQISKLDSIDRLATLNKEFKRNVNTIYNTIIETEQLFENVLQYVYDVWHKTDKSVNQEKRIENKRRLKNVLQQDQALDSFMAFVILSALQQSLFKDCGIVLNPTQEMFNRVIASNKIPTEQFRVVLYGLKEKEARPDKGNRLNTIWDTFILFAAGKTISNEKILIVSGDNKMVNAAKKVAEREKRDNKEVITYSEYMRKLHLEELIPATLKEKMKKSIDN